MDRVSIYKLYKGMNSNLIREGRAIIKDILRYSIYSMPSGARLAFVEVKAYKDNPASAFESKSVEVNGETVTIHFNVKSCIRDDIPVVEFLGTFSNFVADALKYHNLTHAVVDFTCSDLSNILCADSMMYLVSLLAKEDYTFDIKLPTGMRRLRPVSMKSTFSNKYIKSAKGIVDNIDFTYVRSMNGMFEASSITSVDFSKSEFTRVNSVESMFFNCKELKSVELGNLFYCVRGSAKYMFSNCSKLVDLDVDKIIKGPYDRTAETIFTEINILDILSETPKLKWYTQKKRSIICDSYKVMQASLGILDGTKAKIIDLRGLEIGYRNGNVPNDPYSLIKWVFVGKDFPDILVLSDKHGDCLDHLDEIKEFTGADVITCKPGEAKSSIKKASLFPGKLVIIEVKAN